MTAGPLVLVIEDEPSMREIIRASLEANGHRAVEASGGQEGLALATSHNPDVVLLDLGLPDLDGLEVIRRLRTWSKAPIIVLSVLVGEDDKVAALDAGADDYLTKPFGVRELLARLRVAFRHVASRGATAELVLTVGHLRIDLGARQVTVQGTPVSLSPIEYKLLLTLAKNAGRVLTHRRLLQEVWGPNTHEAQYVRVYVGHLRQKLEDDATRPKYLLTEAGVGYRLHLG